MWKNVEKTVEKSTNITKILQKITLKSLHSSFLDFFSKTLDKT